MHVLSEWVAIEEFLTALPKGSLSTQLMCFLSILNENRIFSSSVSNYPLASILKDITEA